MKRNIIKTILLIFIIYGSIGCFGKEKGAVTNTNEPRVTQAPPVKTDSSKQSSFPPIVVNDPLLDLGVEEFKKEYAKLPDDYKIEIGLRHVDFSNAFTDKNHNYIMDMINKDSGTITKKQAEQMIVFATDVHDFFDMSLKGLRYFPNLNSILLESSKLKDISEIGYLTNLENVTFNHCDLGIGESTEELRCLSVMKKVEIDLTGCKLNDIDFLKSINNIDGDSIIFLSNNSIKDISPLTNLKEISYLDLSYNKIKDISPLSSLKRVSNFFYLENNKIKDISPLSSLREVGELVLSENKITDLSPLANLKKADVIWVENNLIRDFSILSNLKERKRLKKYHVK